MTLLTFFIKSLIAKGYSHYSTWIIFAQWQRGTRIGTEVQTQIDVKNILIEWEIAYANV